MVDVKPAKAVCCRFLRFSALGLVNFALKIKQKNLPFHQVAWELEGGNYHMVCTIVSTPQLNPVVIWNSQLFELSILRVLFGRGFLRVFL